MERRYLSLLRWLHGQPIACTFELYSSHRAPFPDPHVLTTHRDNGTLADFKGVLLLSKGKPRIIMPLMVFAWSIPTILFPLVKNGAGFMMARFAVGLAEGAFSPVSHS